MIGSQISKTAAVATVNLLGIPVVAAEVNEALEHVVDGLARPQPHVVAFANANLLNMAHTDASLHELLSKCVVFNDGAGANIAARILYGRPFPANLNGTDLTPALLSRLPAGSRVFLLGAQAKVLSHAVTVFKARWPELVLAGARDGFFTEAEQADVLAEVLATQPALVLVGMGNGRQERVCMALRDASVPSSWAIGALFDFWANVHPRAPMWVRVIGMEWAFRLFREPKRLWRRYLLGNPLFLLRVLRQRFTQSHQAR